MANFTYQAGGHQGVMLHTPPKGDLFAAFHSDNSLSVTPQAAPIPVPNSMPFAPSRTPGPMYNPYAFMTPPPWFMPPMQGSSTTYPSTPTPQSSTHHAILSSDPPDDIGANPYPEICLFFAQLDEKYSC